LIYWKDNWNKFDFVVVVVSVVMYLPPFTSGGDNVSASAFRVFRIARILRLIKKARQLNLLFHTLLYSIPSLWNVGLLLFIAYFIFAVVGVTLFGAHQDEDRLIHPHRQFRTWPRAMLLLYIGSTGDSWTTPWQGLMHENVRDAKDAQGGIAFVYNILFFVILGLIMLNLFIGVILDTYEQNNKINEAEEKMMSVHRFTKYWNTADVSTIGYLPVEQVMGILKDTPWPIGLAYPTKQEHPENIENLRSNPKYDYTWKRFQKMKKQKIKDPEADPPEPTVEELSRHLEQFKIRCEYWRDQNVWVVDFKQLVVAFASKLLNLNVQQDEHPTATYHRWLKPHFMKQKQYLYEMFMDGASVKSPLKEHLYKEEPPEQDEQELLEGRSDHDDVGIHNVAIASE